MDRDPIYKELLSFVRAFFSYIVYRSHKFGQNFEEIKNLVVDILLSRRGANTSLFVHLSILAIAGAVLVTGGFVTSTSVVSGSYPGVVANPLVAGEGDTANEEVITASVTPITIISEKPRDKTLEYEVKKGDTIGTVAAQFAVTAETIQWKNDLANSATLKEGQKLKILPIPGVEHKVESGDTIYSIAKTYRASAQAIIDFPFNDIGDNFQLSTGQTIIVPDGAPPAKAKPAPTQYLAEKNVPTGPVTASGRFLWPASGGISQYFSWYHPALDISNLGGGPVSASDGGRVITAGWSSAGYGNHVVLDHGNGFTTLYAHLSSIGVGVGQSVYKGSKLGMMGSTGRSTGVHLHIEVRQNGAALNPLGLLAK